MRSGEEREGEGSVCSCAPQSATAAWLIILEAPAHEGNTEWGQRARREVPLTTRVDATDQTNAQRRRGSHQTDEQLS